MNLERFYKGGVHIKLIFVISVFSGRLFSGGLHENYITGLRIHEGGNMCLQCVVNAKVVIEDILPGYHLMEATRAISHRESHELEDWPVGWLGLVHMNDPDFVWPFRPVYDPMFQKDEGEDVNMAASIAFLDYVNDMEECFSCSPWVGYRFVQALTQAGYKEKEDGNPISWFLGLVQSRLEKMNYLEDTVGTIKPYENGK